MPKFKVMKTFLTTWECEVEAETAEEALKKSEDAEIDWGNPDIVDELDDSVTSVFDQHSNHVLDQYSDGEVEKYENNDSDDDAWQYAED